MVSKAEEYLELVVFFVDLNAKTDCKQTPEKLREKWKKNIKSRHHRQEETILPARTAVPTQESIPDRKELKGNEPTSAI